MKTKAHFSPELFRFLSELRENNNREWFQANKGRYESAVREPVLRFIADFAPLLHTISLYFVADPSPTGGSLFRIYRDVRFSKDKSPYKTQVGVNFWHVEAGKHVHVPGFYLHLEPGGCFAAAGLWHPDAATLKKIRAAIVARPAAWKAVRRSGLKIEGGTLARPPKGYNAEHPLIEDLKWKDYITSITFSDAKVCGSRFLSDYVAACRRMSPLVKFLTEALGLSW
jgi:uncharacterized protein (TIGR02453 family)